VPRAATERGEAPLGLQLAHAKVRRRHDDVAAERDLDTDGVGDALHRRDSWLGQAAAEAERVHRLRGLPGAALRGWFVRPAHEATTAIGAVRCLTRPAQDRGPADEPDS
jgi:hypothetical protein